MLPFLYVYLHAKKYTYWFFISSAIAHQRILQCDWMRQKTSHTQTEKVFSHATFSWWLVQCNKTRISLLPRKIDDQRILQSDWMRCFTRYTQPNVVISDAVFLWWLTPIIKNNISMGFFFDTLLMKVCCKVIEPEGNQATFHNCGGLRSYIILRIMQKI